LKAFKLNSIDYLLKPVDEAELKAAFTKYYSLKSNPAISNEHLYKLLEQVSNRYLSRFIVKYRDELRIIAIEQVCYLRADDRLVFLYTVNGEKYIIDNSLDGLENELDPHMFFRLNRQYISPFNSIQKISNHFNGKLKLELKNCTDNKIFISREKVHDFRKWLSGN
jgi:two-component system response regulator LytT